MRRGLQLLEVLKDKIGKRAAWRRDPSERTENQMGYGAAIQEKGEIELRAGTKEPWTRMSQRIRGLE